MKAKAKKKLRMPIGPPFGPMELLSVERIPSGPNWQFEPKWDGFRCLAFREGESIELQSKSGKPLTRYFPEVVANLKKLRAQRFVLDGELVIPAAKGLSFDDLLQRIHPAISRVKLLSQETPAVYIVFDLLVDEKGVQKTEQPLRERRALLESFVHRYVSDDTDIRLSPAVTERAEAERWFSKVGGIVDGIIAKRLDSGYRSEDRSGGQKIKRQRTADCVIGGFRYASNAKVIGSVLLGLYDKRGDLHHVGFTSGFSADERKELVKKLTPLIKPPGFTGRAPGGPSRWSTSRSEQWEPLQPKLVVEVSYDHVTARRFRHGTKILRWRPDKAPRQCTMDQIEPRRGNSLYALTEPP